MDIISLSTMLKDEKVLYARSMRSVVRISGKDAKDFIQRMSSNDISELKEEKPLMTCFLNNKGKIVDNAVVFLHDADDFLLVSSFFDENKLIDWLSTYHFVEDLTIQSFSELMPYYELSLLENHGRYSKNLASITLHDELKATISLVLESQSIKSTISHDNWQHLAILGHIAQSPGEINESFMPQNVGLLNTISETKGCYVGQEVIAKALTYQKNTKRLASFILSESDFNNAKIGMKIRDKDQKTGVITTLATCYEASFPQGLAVADDRPTKTTLESHINLEHCFLF